MHTSIARDTTSVATGCLEEYVSSAGGSWHPRRRCGDEHSRNPNYLPSEKSGCKFPLLFSDGARYVGPRDGQAPQRSEELFILRRWYIGCSHS